MLFCVLLIMTIRPATTVKIARVALEKKVGHPWCSLNRRRYKSPYILYAYSSVFSVFLMCEPLLVTDSWTYAYFSDICGQRNR